MARPGLERPLDVRLLDGSFGVGEALDVFADTYPAAGGVVSFLGKVRPDGDVTALELTHYEPMTLPAMRTLAAAAVDRFVLDGVLVWHRIGMMQPGDPIVLVAAAASHRRAAFEGADYLMDHLKSVAWLWKRERRADGWHWIEPRAADHADRARWQMP